MNARLLHIVTHPLSAEVLLRGQLGWMREQGLTVAIASGAGDGLDRAAKREGVEAFAAGLEREIAPGRDLATLLELIGLMRRWRPDIVHASTPKAGLLGMLAARACGVPARVYGQWGLRLETTWGPKRALLTGTEWLACAAAHRVLCASPSLAQRMVELRLAPPHKVAVPARGTTNGVEVERFAPRPLPERKRLREQIGIPEGCSVVGFVGRFTRDKGIPELVTAFEQVHRRRPDVRLLLLGDFEAGDPVPVPLAAQLRHHPAIVCTGFVGDPAPYYGLMDVLAFPSHREGFPNAPLEAAAASVPTVGFRATGTVDAVVEEETGLLVPVGEPVALAEALETVLSDCDLRRRLGDAAHRHVSEDFKQTWCGGEFCGSTKLYSESPSRAGGSPLRRLHPPSNSLIPHHGF
jgi:glycosyltransferase involved in cell wall biosynthesis